MCNVEQNSFVLVVAVAVKNRRICKTSCHFDYGMVYFLQKKLIFVLRSRLSRDFLEHSLGNNFIIQLIQIMEELNKQKITKTLYPFWSVKSE